MPERYTVLRKIADGGMAEIFLGVQSGAAGFERPVVLKRLRASLAQAPEHRNALVDEARVVMGLDHSNIVQVLDVGIAAGLEYLVLEYVRGWDLQCLLKRAAAAQEPLPLGLAVYIASEVCRALVFTHSQSDGERPAGIIHCDVNPNNILVSQEGEVKLTDFGIAMASGAAACALVKGKAGFMSPEQAVGRPLDARSDLFPLGSTLFLMVTGRRPFEGPSDEATLELNKKGRASPPNALRSDLPADIDAVIRKAMQRSLRKRYPSAEAMLADLEAALRKTPEPAGQTELKRWLAALSAKDGIRPITRAELLDSGADLELQVETRVPEASWFDDPSDAIPARAATPPPMPADAATQSPSDEEGRSIPRVPWRGAALGLALAAAAAGGLPPPQEKLPRVSHALEMPVGSGEGSSGLALARLARRGPG